MSKISKNKSNLINPMKLKDYKFTKNKRFLERMQDLKN